MNLERVEVLCLRYLGQAVNPLVPVAKLHAYLVREDDESAPPLAWLLEFLRHHAEIVVLEGPGEEEQIGVEGFAEAGIVMGPRAMLKTRMPSRDQMRAMMLEQVDEMLAKLADALQDAWKQGDKALVAQVEAVVRRAEALREKLAGIGQAEAN